MIAVIVICRSWPQGQFRFSCGSLSDRATGTRNFPAARSSAAASAFQFHRERGGADASSAICLKPVVSVWRTVGHGFMSAIQRFVALLIIWERKPVRQNIFGAIYRLLRAVLLRLTDSVALQACKQSARRVSKAFHVSNLSAHQGLAACVGRTPTSQKETRKCPTIAWRIPT